MKLMFASDIHGSYYYAQKTVEAYREEKAEKLILLGDILYHGPRNDLPKDYAPKKVIELLNGIKNEILCVRGNCDTEVDQMVLDFSILSDYALISIDDVTIFATHGHLVDEQFLSRLNDNDILLCGHTHIPACENDGKHIYLNPGSVSIPKACSKNSYMTFENKTFLWKTLDGEIYKEYKIPV